MDRNKWVHVGIYTDQCGSCHCMILEVGMNKVNGLHHSPSWLECSNRVVTRGPQNTFRAPKIAIETAAGLQPVWIFRYGSSCQFGGPKVIEVQLHLFLQLKVHI